MRVSYIAPAIMYVTIAPTNRECWVLMRWINVHVCYTGTRPAAQPLLPQGRKKIVFYACLIMWHRTSTNVCTASRDYQAFCSSHDLKLCA